MTFQSMLMPVSKKVIKNGVGEHVKVGDATIYVPLLADVIPFITAEQKKDEKGALVFEEGIPVYVPDEANWVQGAMLAMVKAQARNKLMPGSIDLKPNNKIATTWEELCAEGVRDGAGLKILREAKESFADWLSKQSLKDAAVATLNTLFGNKPALTLQPAGVKEKFKARLMAWGESLDEVTMEKFVNPINSLLEACAVTEDGTDGI